MRMGKQLTPDLLKRTGPFDAKKINYPLFHTQVVWNNPLFHTISVIITPYFIHYGRGCIVKREIDRFLDKWKEDPTRIPLMIRGARQVGKSYSVFSLEGNILTIPFYLISQLHRLVEAALKIIGR